MASRWLATRITVASQGEGDPGAGRPSRRGRKTWRVAPLTWEGQRGQGADGATRGAVNTPSHPGSRSLDYDASLRGPAPPLPLAPGILIYQPGRARPSQPTRLELSEALWVRPSARGTLIKRVDRGSRSAEEPLDPGARLLKATHPPARLAAPPSRAVRGEARRGKRSATAGIRRARVELSAASRSRKSARRRRANVRIRASGRGGPTAVLFFPAARPYSASPLPKDSGLWAAEGSARDRRGIGEGWSAGRGESRGGQRRVRSPKVLRLVLRIEKPIT
jgi:hypothetical protein